MKIRPLTPDTLPKAAALLDHVFAPSRREVQLFDKLHERGRTLHEWVCLVRTSVIAYIGFTRAFHNKQIVGLHLGLLAVQPQWQGQGIGSELLRFALRQEEIREQAVFVLGNPRLLKKFGFVPCPAPRSPFAQENTPFLSLRNHVKDDFTIGYDPEFSALKTKKRSKMRSQ